MAALFSFQHRIDLEEYLKYSKTAIAIEDVVKTKALTGCVQTYKMEGYHLNIKKLQLLFVIMPTHHFLYGNMCFDTNT